MRGPFSALYGNSSGGVVQMWSKPGEAGDPTRLRATYGSYDARSLGAQTLGKSGFLDYNLALSRFETDGYREHSAARRDSANARLGFDVGERRTLSLVMNYLDLPDAQDPLGLTPADWRADPQPGHAGGHPVQYAQVRRPAAGRHGVRAGNRRSADAARHGLLRQSPGRAVPRDTRRPRRPIR